MFFYRDHSTYIINTHVSEKTKFYTYLNLMKIKTIIILIKYVSVRYSVLPSMYDMVTSIRTSLFFSNYMNYKLLFKYNNATKDFYKIYISGESIYKYNMFYFFYIGYNYMEFNDSFFLERRTTKNRVKLHTLYKISYSKLAHMPSSEFYSDVRYVYSTISFFCDTTSNNYYLNKIFYSHTYLNIL